MTDPIKALAPKMPTAYLRTFFEEKVIQPKIFEVEGEWGLNLIENACVVEHITLVGDEEAAAIEGVLRRIDFANGDVNHFLGHLAKALAI